MAGSTGTGSGAGFAGPGDAREKSIPDLLKELSQETTTLVKQELDLAKAEIAEKGKQAGTGAGLFGGAGVVGLLAGGAFTAFLIALLSEWMDTWVAALIVTVLYGAIAAVLAMRGKKEIQKATPPAPEQTIETIKEDVEWAKTQTRSGAR
jgi:hypothetical protein